MQSACGTILLAQCDAEALQEFGEERLMVAWQDNMVVADGMVEEVGGAGGVGQSQYLLRGRCRRV